MRRMRRGRRRRMWMIMMSRVWRKSEYGDDHDHDLKVIKNEYYLPWL